MVALQVPSLGVSRGPVDGAGPHVKKVRPSKRIKAAHRAYNKHSGFAPRSLRVFARLGEQAGDSKDEQLIASWFSNKKAVR